MNQTSSRSLIPILNARLHLDPQKILDVLHLAEGDIVSFGGTLIEGIGNRHSDIDINVICKNRQRFDVERFRKHAFVHRRDMTICASPEDDVFMTMDYYPGSAFHLDVEYWTFDEFDEILFRVQENFSRLLEHSDKNYTEGGLSRLERLVLTRVMHGVTIHGDANWSKRKTHDVTRHYAYTLYRGLANNYWLFKDICGALEAKHDAMACDLARTFLLDEARAALHLNGLVNSTQKWFFVFWESMGPEIYPNIHAKVLRLLFCVDVTRSWQYVTDVLAIIEDIEAVNRKITDAHTEFPSTARQLALLEEERKVRSGSNSLVQEHEFLFRHRSFVPNGPSYVDLLTYL